MNNRKRLIFFLACMSAIILFNTSLQSPREASATKGNLNLKKLEVDEFFTDHDGTFILRDIKKNLPFDKDVMKTVKRMMIQKEEDHFTLYGKTGQGSGIGWYVGFIGTDNGAYSFATNIAGTSTDAKNMTIDILKKYKLMTDS